MLHDDDDNDDDDDDEDDDDDDEDDDENDDYDVANEDNNDEDKGMTTSSRGWLDPPWSDLRSTPPRPLLLLLPATPPAVAPTPDESPALPVILSLRLHHHQLCRHRHCRIA